MTASCLQSEKVSNKSALKAVIITAADSGYFVPLQYLISSIRKFHGNTKIICINLGLTNNQKNWLKKQKVYIQLPPKLYIDRNIDHWQTWNKPLYIQRQKCKSVIWIDADCVLLDKINFIDRSIKGQFTIFADTGAIKFWGIRSGNDRMRNLHSLNIFNDNEFPNAGVIGIDLRRDRKILKRWVEIIKFVKEHYEFNQCHLKFYDQGALQYVMEEQNITDLVIQDDRYNFAATLMEVTNKQIENEFQFFEYLSYLKNKNVKISHFLAKQFYFKIKFNPNVINSLKRRFYNPENPEEIITQTIRRFPLGTLGVS